MRRGVDEKRLLRFAYSDAFEDVQDKEMDTLRERVWPGWNPTTG